jgi:hypothetical protein
MSVRLRPELRPTESIQPLDDVSRAIDSGALEGDPDALLELLMMTAQPPQSLLRSIYATLTDKYWGLAALGLASLRERGTLGDKLHANLPGIEGVATTDEARLALVRLWLAQWSTPTRGIWLRSMTDGDWLSTKGGVKPHAGKFQLIERWLGSPAARKKFNQEWLPTLRQEMCELVGTKYRLLAARVALETGGLWGYCERCRFTQRPFPDTVSCVSCGADQVRVLAPRPTWCSRPGKATTGRALSVPWLTRPSRP